MSVNLPLRYRVIAIIVTVGVAFSTLAWSGENHWVSPTQPGQDTIPSRVKPSRKVVKPRHQEEEGRVARELDLRMDADEFDGLPVLPESDILSETDLLKDPNISADLESLKGLNARIEADMFPNAEAWKNLGAMKELGILDGDDQDEDALDELKDMDIAEQDLQALKYLNIDEEIWNELKDLKEEMDDLRSEIEEDRSNGDDDYCAREKVSRVIEAVRAEMPRVRKEVEKALQEYRQSQGREWQ